MTRIVTAMFQDAEAAERARGTLRALGIPENRIGLHADPRSHAVQPATDGSIGSEPGIPALLDTLFLPDADFEAHKEALRRGHVVVSAELEPGEVERATRALEQSGAADMDAAEEGWKREGWSPAAMAGAVTDATAPTAAMPGTGGMDAEAARMLATGSLGTNTTGGAGPVTGGASQDPRKLARREPPIGRARSYVIEAPLAEEGDP